MGWGEVRWGGRALNQLGLSVVMAREEVQVTVPPPSHISLPSPATHLTLFSCCCGGGSRSRRLGGAPSLASQLGSRTANAAASATRGGAALPDSGVRAGLLAAESGAGRDVLLPVRRMPRCCCSAPPLPAADAAATVGPPLPLSSSEAKPVRSTLWPRLWVPVRLPDSHS